MPRKPLYWLFTSLLYCMWEQQTALSPGASLSTELREFGRSVVMRNADKKKSTKTKRIIVRFRCFQQVTRAGIEPTLTA